MTNLRATWRWLLVTAWVAILALAFSLDRKVATWVHDGRPVNKNARFTHQVLMVLKLPGNFWFILCIAILLAIFHRHRLGAALALILSGISTGLLYSVVKWTVGRHRPVRGIRPFEFHFFPGGIRGLFDPEDALCFPSGHATLAFASATCLALLIPRWSFLFYAIAVMTSLERVMENAHYLSDVVAGAGFGIMLGLGVTRTLMQKLFIPEEALASAR